MILVQNRVRTCSSKNCKEKYFAKGFCKHHYEQSPEVIEKRRVVPVFNLHIILRTCSSRNCKEKYYAKGFCKYHYEHTPEVIEKRRESDRKYKQRPEVKAKAKAREQTPKYKAMRKKQNESDKRKAKRKEPESRRKQREWQRKYDSDPKNKSRKKEYAHSPITLARRKTIRDEMRLEVLQYYSKRLSKSNIPCCRCCGENSNIGFLAVDHIAGKKEMDSEPELVELGYSSSKKIEVLWSWIIKNNFPKGFQILCHNCNLAKGFYGKCPHQK